MDKRQMQAEELETMELLSGKIEAETPCAQTPEGKTAEEKRADAAGKIDRAVGAAAERCRSKKRE